MLYYLFNSILIGTEDEPSEVRNTFTLIKYVRRTCVCLPIRTYIYRMNYTLSLPLPDRPCKYFGFLFNIILKYIQFSIFIGNWQ